MKYFIIFALVILASCQTAEKDGHAHDANGQHETDGVEIPTADYTIWTDKTELFVEFPVLVVGEPSRFAAHFTVLDKHQPVREGSVMVSLVDGATGIRHKVDSPSDVGIFKPTLVPKKAGVYTLVFELKSLAVTDKIVIENVQVFATKEEAAKSIKEEAKGGAITFLKEQAWKIDFQTAPVVQGNIYDVIPTSGVWNSSSADNKNLIATTSGRVSFKATNLAEGKAVSKGQTLMTISSSGLTKGNLNAELGIAKANLAQAKAEYNRKKQLNASKIVSDADFEIVLQKYQSAQANYQALNQGYSSNGRTIVAPISGYVKSINVVDGDFVDQGAALLSVSTGNSAVLEVKVSPTYAQELSFLQDIWYQPTANNWTSLKQSGGDILSVGKSVKADQPMLIVSARANGATTMPEGSFTEVQLLVGRSQTANLIPESALMEDYGNYSVIVQTSGESFERREVTIGRRNGDKVEIIKGLKVGEVIVSTGAYQVKMQSMSGQAPAHGHAH